LIEETFIHLYEMEKKQRLELQEEAKARGMFLDVLAHELRTPLTPVLSSISMLREILEKSDDKTLKRLSENIYSGARTLTERLEELLEVASYSRGTFKLHKQPTDVSKLIKDLAGLFEQKVEANNQRIILTLPDHIPEVQLDQSRIEQVLVNLISNANKFAPQGQINLIVKVDQDRIHFSVTDQGMGISKEDQLKIFGPYHRVEQDRQKYPGIGLGLNVSRNIVEAHGGEIQVISELGKGSTFTFWLPLKY
jgi:two-component system, OmpR family, aerobic respiration control sensor histidine kinase ArcB